ncbi:MAG: NUDIX domain-containing protein [Streptosporangiaceae bacterium]
MKAEAAGRVITAALVVVPGPDGTVEFGEPIEQAARREAAEECGSDPGELVLTGAYEIIGPGHHFVMLSSV